MSSAYRYCPACGQPFAARAEGGTGGASGAAAPPVPRSDGRAACTCGFIHWDNPVPVVAAIVEHEGAVLLARNKDWPEKMYGLVTGFLEKDEAPEDGVKREVKEELDLDATAAHLVGLYPFGRRNELIIAYHVPAEGTVRLNEELADYRRIAPEKLRPWDFGTGLAVRDWLARRAAAAT